MPRGSSDIPTLRLEVLQKFVTKFTAPPELMLMNLFPSSPSPSSTIKWESQRGGRGLTPFVPPGAPAHQTAPTGVAEHLAEAAYWKEKMPMDEEFLNNLRAEGTTATYLSAAARLARELASLKNRAWRRKEWMFSKMMFNNGFDYKVKDGYMASVDYAIPQSHRITLGTNYQWDDGSSKNILKDIQDGKRTIKEDCGGTVDLAMCNSKVLDYLANDTTIRGILQKNAFGDGSLFKGNLHELVGVNPGIIGGLLNISNFVVYDEMYEVKAFLTSTVTGGSTTHIAVDDVSDFEANSKLRIVDRSANTWEDLKIIDVNEIAGTIQVSAPPASTYKAMEDFVLMPRNFIPDDTFVMMSTKVEGQSIAEYKQAPFGLGRHYGQYTDKHDEWDPEVTWIRVQDKGLPILYHPDAVYTIDVVTTAYESATSTTTTTTTTTTAP
jgi:hypothetical protein